MDGKLRNMASIYIVKEDQMLLLYRQGGRVVNKIFILKWIIFINIFICQTNSNCLFSFFHFVKTDPEWRDVFRQTFSSVIPAYHLNKEHWNSIILDETVPEKDIKRMISESYDLTAPKKKIHAL